MLIAFGTRFCGKIATVNDQWIESKFFSVMFIPIFPVSSMFVTGSEFRRRSGIPIPMNGKSVAAVYGRILSLPLAVLFLVLGYGDLTSYGSPNIIADVILLLLGLGCAAMCFYFYMYFGKATADDAAMRTKVGNLTGYYALPSWLDTMYMVNMLEALETRYKELYPDGDWKADLQSQNIVLEKRKLLYGLALFNCMINDLPENDELYAKADQLAWE